MPTYCFACACGNAFETHSQTVPKREVVDAECIECGKRAPRDREREIREGDVAPLNASSSKDMAETMAIAGRREAGKLVYTNANGRSQEVRTASDVEKWMKGDNQLGPPRRREVVNPYTGKKEWAVERKGGIRFDPVTKEQVDTGPIVREAARLVPLTGEPKIPERAPSGLPIKNGVMQGDPRKVRLRAFDPVLGKRPTLGDLFVSGDEVGDAPVNTHAVKQLRGHE